MTTGAALLAVALLGWIGTLVALPFLRNPAVTEDVTAAWKQAGPTTLGRTAAVTVPPRQTLVAFLVGTQIYGPGGTTGGSCTATGDGSSVDLGRVLINQSLNGVLRDGQETVAIAGWTNDGDAPVRVDIRCITNDSTVDHFVAVPTRTAVGIQNPWFQPWLWVAVATLGVAVFISGLDWLSPPSR
jgi:hypothetical protein